MDLLLFSSKLQNTTWWCSYDFAWCERMHLNAISSHRISDNWYILWKCAAQHRIHHVCGLMHVRKSHKNHNIWSRSDPARPDPCIIHKIWLNHAKFEKQLPHDCSTQKAKWMEIFQLNNTQRPQHTATSYLYTYIQTHTLPHPALCAHF